MIARKNNNNYQRE